MSEKINKLYKPAELEEAIEILSRNLFVEDAYKDAKTILIALHKAGWRLVKCNP